MLDCVGKELSIIGDKIVAAGGKKMLNYFLVKLQGLLLRKLE